MNRSADGLDGPLDWRIASDETDDRELLGASRDLPETEGLA